MSQNMLENARQYIGQFIRRAASLETFGHDRRDSIKFDKVWQQLNKWPISLNNGFDNALSVVKWDVKGIWSGQGIIATEVPSWPSVFTSLDKGFRQSDRLIERTKRIKPSNQRAFIQITWWFQLTAALYITLNCNPPRSIALFPASTVGNSPIKVSRMLKLFTNECKLILRPYTELVAFLIIWKDVLPICDSKGSTLP